MAGLPGTEVPEVAEPPKGVSAALAANGERCDALTAGPVSRPAGVGAVVGVLLSAAMQTAATWTQGLRSLQLHSPSNLPLERRM
jgi:hypothetical protein